MLSRDIRSVSQRRNPHSVVNKDNLTDFGLEPRNSITQVSATGNKGPTQVIESATVEALLVLPNVHDVVYKVLLDKLEFHYYVSAQSVVVFNVVHALKLFK